MLLHPPKERSQALHDLKQALDAIDEDRRQSRTPSWPQVAQTAERVRALGFDVIRADGVTDEESLLREISAHLRSWTCLQLLMQTTSEKEPESLVNTMDQDLQQILWRVFMRIKKLLYLREMQPL